MSPFIPDNILDEILDKCDIAEIVSSYIPLRKVGRNYKALCPFHHEKTPSFIVNPEKGIFHCFGCGVGGNAFSFIMKYERLEFPEVVRMVAKRTGVALPERSTKDSRGSSSEIDGIYKIHEFATAYFQNTLMSPPGKQVREYLAKRGIQGETARKFRLGLAPDSWNSLFTYLKSKNFKEGLIAKTGLIIPRPDKSGYYDRFRKRLIFPIFNQRDKVIAFAGRVIDDSQPKYMNSPETQIYNKSRTLFGLNFAKKDINEKDVALIVEGYTDLMVPHQGGIKNIVASCGTALTPEQVRLLKRHSPNVIMVYDSDKAGEMATLRSLDLLLAEDMHVAIARLPKDCDPDNFVRKYGIKKFQEVLSGATGLLEYKLGVLTSIHGIENAQSKTRVAGEMLKTISKINNAILKSEYIKKLAECLKVDESGLRAELVKVKKEYDGGRYAERPYFKNEIVSISAADKIIVGLMIEDNNLIPFVKKKLDCSEFDNKFSRAIVKFIFTLNGENKPVSYSVLINRPETEGLDGLLSEIATKHPAFTDKKKNLEDCISWIKKNNLKRSLDKLRDQIKEAEETGEQKRITELVIRYNKLIKSAI